ncbi:DUF4156 domain-containing protein [Paracoccus mangrovi]|uniref:DUF4156 domain-containing protein n=1 Tax=Paracoccus mangrovi TaxID=1715645 RepID=A0ABV7R9J0_9RHOB
MVPVAAILILSACSTQLSQSGKKVRQISLHAADNCQFIGSVTGSESMGIDEAMDVGSAFNKVRNAVAQMGGDAFVVSATSTSISSTVVQADAYRCSS